MNKYPPKNLGWWYHDFEFPDGTRTGTGKEPSYRPELRWRLVEPWVPPDLSGKTVLDVGGCSGYFSVQMLLRGASRAVLVEPYEEFAEQARYTAKQFGVNIEIICEDIHTWVLTNDSHFDYVIFFGVFYHLRYPLLVLDRLAEMTRERMLFQSNVVGSEEPIELDVDLNRGASDAQVCNPGFPRMAFIEKLYNSDPTNWWVPNAAAIEPILRSAGMRVIARPHEQLAVADPEQSFGVHRVGSLVFPRFGKRLGGAAVHPGPQRVDPELWSRLIALQEKAREEME